MPQSIQKGSRDLMNKGFRQNATEDDSLEVVDADVDYFDNETEFDEIKEGKAEVKDLKAAIFAMVKKKLEQLVSEMCLSSAAQLEIKNIFFSLVSLFGFIYLVLSKSAKFIIDSEFLILQDLFHDK